MKIMRKIVKKMMIILPLFSKIKNITKNIKEICQANYNADVSASELIPKIIIGLSSYTVYRHYQSLRDKGTSNRKIGSGR